MSQRLVAIIDADQNLGSHLSAELQRYGLTVELSADSTELMSRKDDFPILVVLCIDPKRTGWAVCNRLRKSPLLKSIPLVITSAEATEKDFDDHKKLKTRAEEYLHKPFSADQLVEKIRSLVGLPEVDEVAEAAEIDIEPEEMSAEDLESDGVAIDMPAEEIAVEDEMTMGGRAQPAAAYDTSDEESTRIGLPNEIDGEVDLETNAAFAAIGMDEPADNAGQDGDGASPFDDDPFGLPEPPPKPAVAAAAAPAAAAAGAATVAAAPAPAPAVSVKNTPAPADLDSAPVPRMAAEELGLDLDDVARDAAAISAQATAPIAVEAADRAALDEARRELERLRKENEELRARPKAEPAAAAPASSFSREREFLNLRETINKKEKEILDAKDALDSKDRQVLDAKDKLREMERRLREGEERSLATERDLVAANEKIEALTNDKERAVEREKQVKGRLEDVQKALQRAEQELEQAKAKAVADAAAAEEKLTQLRTSNAESLADLKTEHQSVLERERQAREAEKQALLSQHAGEVERLRETHAQETAQRIAEHKQTLENELRAAERRHAEIVVDVEAQHDQKLRAAEQQHQEALKAQADEARQTLEQAVNAELAERARLEASHARTIESLDLAKQEALAAAATAAAEQQAAALAQQKSEHEGELKAAREQHARKLQALEESHEDLKAGMQSRHAAAVDELKKQHAAAVAEWEGAVGERDQIITDARNRQTELEAALAGEQQQSQARAQEIESLRAELEAAKAELESRGQTIETRNQRVAELEQESARYQDQILRAYQRIKADESIVARAKKALAIALTLLEENDGDGPEEASS